MLPLLPLLAALAPAMAETADLPPARDGSAAYARYCVGCHGERGDGRGPAAAMLITKPRDFTSGVYKFRSTPTGALPTDADLFRTITQGLPRTSMPAWSLVSERERWALVAFVKAFYPDWATRGAEPPIVVPPRPAGFGSPEAVARGGELYGMLGCVECHGPGGRGDGTSAATMAPDVWGNPQRPANFTRGLLKSGSRPEDIYRTFMTGLNGTAMPAYMDVFGAPDGETIREGDAWSLVSFVLSLRERAAGKDAAP